MSALSFLAARLRRKSGLEAELRALRPQPRNELVAMLSAEIGRRPASARPAHRARTALALAFSVGLLAVLSAFGGAGYAASQTSTLVHLAIGKSHKGATTSAADDQYRPGKGCGDKNHQHVPKPGQKPCPPHAH
jgi:hypothetical protein